MARLTLLYATPDGSIGEAAGLRPLDLAGGLIAASELIPMPAGTTVAMMPGRLAVGRDRQGKRVTLTPERGWAISAFLPIGYTRTRIPGYDVAPPEATPPQAETLPFFGYTALVSRDGELCVAALATDDPERWHPDAYAEAELAPLVRRRLQAEPENRVLQQHAHCALDYHCPTASNLFFGRWEGAIAVAGGCNARCIGCISKQDEGELISPQDRLTFVPSVAEIVAVGLDHLRRSPEAIISFGQGCEGEPLLQARVIEQAIRELRAQTDQGTININTNASNPRAVARLAAAGLDSLRASTISARVPTYDAYYRPIGYTLEHVKRSLIVAREAGCYTSINLLLFPGIADAEDEAAAWVDFLRETGTCLVELRNLNIDPELLLPQLPARGPAMGIRAFIDLLQRELPDLRIGNFSVPLRRREDGRREPMQAPWLQRLPVATPPAPQL